MDKAGFFVCFKSLSTRIERSIVARRKPPQQTEALRPQLGEWVENGGDKKGTGRVRKKNPTSKSPSTSERGEHARSPGV